MIQYIVRPAKRFAVLIPGVIIAYLSVQTIVPYFDQRLPLALAILLAYITGAYILVPALIRITRIFLPANHLPLYCVTPDGFASDPLNIGIVGTRLELIRAMQAAGWHVADQKNPRTVFRQIVSGVLDRMYANAPVSNLYLFGRKQDIAFEIPLGGSGSNRHHVRFWATTYESDKKLSFHNIHWHNRKAHVFGDSLLWVGAASLDHGFGFIRHNLQITHMIHPDTNSEREMIVSGLTKNDCITAKTTNVQLGKPHKVINRVFTGFLLTDGVMTVVRLKKRLLK